MTMYELSIWDLRLIDALRYFREHSTGAEYCAVMPQVHEAMSGDAWHAFMWLVYGEENQ